MLQRRRDAGKVAAAEVAAQPAQRQRRQRDAQQPGRARCPRRPARAPRPAPGAPLARRQARARRAGRSVGMRCATDSASTEKTRKAPTNSATSASTRQVHAVGARQVRHALFGLVGGRRLHVRRAAARWRNQRSGVDAGHRRRSMRDSRPGRPKCACAPATSSTASGAPAAPACRPRAGAANAWRRLHVRACRRRARPRRCSAAGIQRTRRRGRARPSGSRAWRPGAAPARARAPATVQRVDAEQHAASTRSAWPRPPCQAVDFQQRAGHAPRPRRAATRSIQRIVEAFARACAGSGRARRWRRARRAENSASAERVDQVHRERQRDTQRDGQQRDARGATGADATQASSGAHSASGVATARW